MGEDEMGLTRYQVKRNFSRTREPEGRRLIRGVPDSNPVFVIQKHAARHLHYDFRLAMDGVLKSWAVPKGIPTKQGEKRLAMQVEDHPLEYANFEGIIPKGNYGAGSVMVWDRGTYHVADDKPVTALRKGKIVMRLAGTKLQGQWTLVRMRRRDEPDHKAWLLIKTEKDVHPISAREDDTSAQSGRAMKEIASNDRNTKKSQSKASSKSQEHHKDTIKSLPSQKTLPASAPRFVEPMKALLESELPRGNEWRYEVKLDGVRAIGIKNGQHVHISR
jgi:bifunctional non-homologous end joining protein LigD